MRMILRQRMQLGNLELVMMKTEEVEMVVWLRQITDVSFDLIPGRRRHIWWLQQADRLS